MRPPSLAFRQRLIAQLQQRGYVVYTDIGKDTIERINGSLPDTAPLIVKLGDIFYLAEKVRCIVGVRSGLLYLLSFSSGNLICFSPSQWTHNDLKIIHPDTPGSVRTLYFNWELFPKINELIHEQGIESMTIGSIKHKSLPVEQLFFDENKLLEATLKSLASM